MELNKIIFGDNLTILKELPSDSIDLIYLDPPFFTQTNWTKNMNTFGDKWKDMNEYINFMSLRLKELHRVLKPTGTIYLHCDYHANSELNIEMKKIFGYKNYQTTIIWKLLNSSFGNKVNKIFHESTDTILVYTKSNNYIYKKCYTPYPNNIQKQYKNPDNDPKGKYVWKNFSSRDGIQQIPNETKLKENEESNIKFIKKEGYKYFYKQYNHGRLISNIWDDIGRGGMRYKYPTQKPEKLLERIILASSNPGDIVLDPFCGSGTTCVVAKKLGRNYIGIDQSEDAVKLTEERLDKINIPKSLWE